MRATTMVAVADKPHRSAPWWSWSLATIVIVVLWMTTFFAAQLLEYQPLRTLWYPATAVTFAAFSVFRFRAWPGLLIANVIGGWVTFQRVLPEAAPGHMLLFSILFAIAHCVPYWLAAEATLQSIPRNAAPSLAKTVGAFLLAGIMAGLIAAVGGGWLASISGLAGRNEIWSIILPRLIADIAGLVSAGPLLAMLLRSICAWLIIPMPHRLYAFDDLPRPPRDIRVFLLKLSWTLVAVVLSLLAIAQAPDNEALLLVVFIAIIVQLWIVNTQGAMESLISVALFNLTLVALVCLFGIGEHALTLQFAMITLAAGSYYGLAVPMLYADNAQLRRLLIHDALTGIYNRHFFVELSHQSIRQSRISEQPVSMLMLDMDNLKLINDRHGHAAGDKALAHIAKVCRESLTANDLLGRLGGDEFCVLLPGQDHATAARTAERLISAVRATAYPTVDDIRPSMSIGISTTLSEADDYDSLWMRADSALYVAKRGGRDRIAQEETPEESESA